MNQKELATVKKNIAAKLRELRGDLDQVTFAQKCQTSQGCISSWEKGDRLPSTESLMDIAKGCRISVADIIAAAVKGLPPYKPEPVKKAAPVVKKPKPKKPTKSKAQKRVEAQAAALAAVEPKPVEPDPGPSDGIVIPDADGGL